MDCAEPYEPYAPHNFWRVHHRSEELPRKYLVPGRDGLEVWPDERVFGTLPPSPPPPPSPEPRDPRRPPRRTPAMPGDINTGEIMDPHKKNYGSYSAYIGQHKRNYGSHDPKFVEKMRMRRNLLIVDDNKSISRTSKNIPKSHSSGKSIFNFPSLLSPSGCLIIHRPCGPCTFWTVYSMLGGGGGAPARAAALPSGQTPRLWHTAIRYRGKFRWFSIKF